MREWLVQGVRITHQHACMGHRGGAGTSARYHADGAGMASAESAGDAGGTTLRASITGMYSMCPTASRNRLRTRGTTFRKAGRQSISQSVSQSIRLILQTERRASRQAQPSGRTSDKAGDLYISGAWLDA